MIRPLEKANPSHVLSARTVEDSSQRRTAWWKRKRAAQQLANLLEKQKGEEICTWSHAALGKERCERLKASDRASDEG